VLTIGDPFLPPYGPCWTLLLIWACAHIGGFIIQKVGSNTALNPPSLSLSLSDCRFLKVCV
jgi:hypothetical protein